MSKLKKVLRPLRTGEDFIIQNKTRPRQLSPSAMIPQDATNLDSNEAFVMERALVGIYWANLNSIAEAVEIVYPDINNLAKGEKRTVSHSFFMDPICAQYKKSAAKALMKRGGMDPISTGNFAVKLIKDILFHQAERFSANSVVGKHPQEMDNLADEVKVHIAGYDTKIINGEVVITKLIFHNLGTLAKDLLAISVMAYGITKDRVAKADVVEIENVSSYIPLREDLKGPAETVNYEDINPSTYDFGEEIKDGLDVDLEK